MKHEYLDLLVKNGVIQSYQYEDQNDGPKDQFLMLEFLSGETLRIESCCGVLADSDSWLAIQDDMDD